MKRMMKRIATSKRLYNYCENMLRMYNYGRVSMLA